MPTPGDTDILDLSGNGMGVDLGEDNFTRLTADIFATRAEMANVLGAAGDIAYLKEAGREGFFKWNATDLAASFGVSLAVVDPFQGIFIAPAGTNGFLGAWERKIEGDANLLWWGALPGVGDVSANVQAAVDTLEYIKQPNVYGYGLGVSIPLYVPNTRYGVYNCGGTKIIVDHGLRIRGSDMGSASAQGSAFKWNDGTGGIRFTAAAGGCVLEGITFLGGFAGGNETESHAIEVDAGIKIRDCSAYNWGGNAIHEENDTGAGTGNSNGFEVDGFYAENCRDGHYAQGGDVNAGCIKGMQGKANRRWSINQQGLLGTMYEGCSFSGGGRTAWNTGAANRPCSFVFQTGFWYFVIDGQEAWCSVNAPTGTATSNQGWGYWAPNAAPGVGVPQWFNGINVRSGGNYHVKGLNNRSGFYSCYSEDDTCNQFDQVVLNFSPTMGFAYRVSAGVLQGRAPFVGGDGICVYQPSSLSQTRISLSSNTILPLIVHNSSALSGAIASKMGFAVGYEADGVTPAEMMRIEAKATSAVPNNNEPVLTWSSRAFTTGLMTARFSYSTAFNTFYPESDKLMDLGGSSNHFKDTYVQTVKVNNLKVLGAQGAAITDAAVSVAAPTKAEFDALVGKFNTLLARVRAATGHGLIA